MNPKRLLVACLTAFIFIFVYEWVFHGVVLKAQYVASANLWRPEGEMRNHMPWLIGGQFLMAVMFTFIFARFCPRHDAGIGGFYGLCVGLLMAAPALIDYAVQPVPLGLIGAWIGSGLLEFLIAGAIVGAIYRPPAPSRG